MEQIKPCPFCGCEMKLKDTHFIEGEKAWRLVGEHGEDCIFDYSFYIPEAFYISSRDKETIQNHLIEAWNRRVSE